MCKDEFLALWATPPKLDEKQTLIYMGNRATCAKHICDPTREEIQNWERFESVENLSPTDIQPELSDEDKKEHCSQYGLIIDKKRDAKLWKQSKRPS